MSATTIIYEPVNSLEQLQKFQVGVVNDTTSKLRLLVAVTLQDLVEVQGDSGFESFLAERIFDESSVPAGTFAFLRDFAAQPTTIEGQHIILDVVANLVHWVELEDCECESV